MAEEVKIYEIMDEVKNLGDTITKCVEKEELNDRLVAGWAFDALQLVGKLGKLVEELEDRLDLLEEEMEKKKF